MRSFGFRLIGALVVVGASFLATLQLLDYWSAPSPPLAANADVIEVVEATYGKNCQNFTPPPAYPNLVKAGNATAPVAQACDKAKESCRFYVDLAKTSDPAPGCAKDFMVSWRCGGDPSLHQSHVAAEANNKVAVLSCP